jgi:hypothetical protein
MAKFRTVLTRMGAFEWILLAFLVGCVLLAD